MFQLVSAAEVEKFVWLGADVPLKVEWKSAMTIFGGQCVMMHGITRMLEWYADNLDYHHYVSNRTLPPCKLHTTVIEIQNK